MSGLIKRARRSTVSAGAVLAIASTPLLAPTAGAQEDIAVDFPAGVVCDFPVGLTYPGPTRDEWGGDVLFAGSNGPIDVTNLDTGEILTVPKRGTQVRLVSVADDGTETYSISGHVVVALFPSDIPGPALLLNTGRLVYDVSPEGDWTVTSQRGRSTDLCAALS